MDLTLEEYLEFEQHLQKQRDEDEEIPVDEPVYWCYKTMTQKEKR